MGDCAWNQYGSELDFANLMILSGRIKKSSVNLPRGLGGQRTSEYTSVLSYLEHKYPFLKINLPSWMIKKSPRLIGKARETATLFRFAGRWIPLLGWGLFATDIAQITYCVSQKIQNSATN